MSCKICGKVLAKNGHLDRHIRAVHKVEMKIRKRGRPKKGEERDPEFTGGPKKLDEFIGLDEYMSTVAEKENDFDHDDNEYAIKQVENAPEVATKQTGRAFTDSRIQMKINDEGGVERALGSVSCKICGKVLSKNGHLDRHIRAVHKVEMKKRKRGRPGKGEERDPEFTGGEWKPRKDREANQQH